MIDMSLVSHPPVMIDMPLVSSMWATKRLESEVMSRETSFHPGNKYFLTISQVRSIKVSLFVGTAMYSQKINDM